MAEDSLSLADFLHLIITSTGFSNGRFSSRATGRGLFKSRTIEGRWLEMGFIHEIVARAYSFMLDGGRQLVVKSVR